MKFKVVAAVGCLAALVGSALAAGPDLAALKEKYRRPTAIPFPDKAPYSPQLATLARCSSSIRD
jgi:cytochrome c peroxidase